MKIILKHIHLDNFTGSVTNVERLRFYDWNEVLNHMRNCWEDWTTIDDDILMTEKKVMLSPRYYVEVEVKD